MEEKVNKIDISELIPDDKNFNKGTEYGAHLLEKSFEQFGAGRSILLDKNNRIIAGNKATEKYGAQGGEKVIVVETDGKTLVAVKRTDVDLDSKEGRELALADNATGKADLAWDDEVLKAVAEDMEIDVEDWGVELEEEPVVLETEEDNYDTEQEVESRVHRGEVWQLGEHRLMCGDSTSSDVAILMNGEKADLVFTDPPYGMKKESEGVLNDNLNYDDLLDFNKQWIPLTFEMLKDNGSWYCWGTDEPLMDIYSEILKPKIKRNEITFRNLITWDKGDAGAGGVSFIGKDGLRSYPIADEKCLFVMCGVQGFARDSSTWYDGFEVFRKYIEDELKKANLTIKGMQDITNTYAGHYVSKSQYSFPTEEHYLILQNYGKKYGAFQKGYDEIKQEYEKIKQEYEKIKQEWYETRAFFDNTHDNMTDVWQFERCRGDERAMAGGHATPKPLALCSRAIKSSSREGEQVLDVFGGSGSTLIACEQLNRKCRMMELDEHYCDVILNRWETLTGKKAQKIE